MVTRTKSPEPTIVALTGASGFVGSQILKKLLARGYRVKALQNRSRLEEHENLQIVSGSLSDLNSLKQLVSDTSSVIHCGGVVAAQDERGFFDSNEIGTKNIVSAAEDENIESFLYISSMAARAPHVSPYAASKLAGENALRESKIENWDIIRPPAVYGPGDKQILPLMQLLQKRVGLLSGGREAKVSVIYVEDLARAVCCWLSANGERQHGKIYEIDDGKENGYSWQDLLSTAADEININPFYISPPRFLLKGVGYCAKLFCKLTGQTPFLTPDKMNELRYPDWVRKERTLENDIDWNSRVNFRNGVRQTLSWYQEMGLMNNMNLRDAK